MFSQKQWEQFREMTGNKGGMAEHEASTVLLLAEIRDSLNRLVELAESDYADEDGPAPRSLGER